LCVGIIVTMLFISGALIGAGVVLAAAMASKPLAWLLGTILLVGFIALFAWVGLRMSMALPMTFAERRIRIFEAWDLTRGHVGNLFLMMLLVIAVVLLIEIAVVVLGVFAVLALAGLGGVLDLSALSTQHGEALMRRLYLLTPGLLIGAAVIALVAAAFQAIIAAPWAVAYRAIAPQNSPA